MDVSELHTWWEIPSIAHFFSLFSETFGLMDFDIEELEKWLLEAGTDAGSPFLIDLLCKVMKGCYNNKRQITHANFEFYFRDLIKKRWELSEGKVNPFYENDMNFRNLPVRTKVEMIQSLCDYRLTADDVIDKLKYFETDDLRKVPVGKDGSGALYWYFYGTRLYREVPDVKHSHTSKHDEKEMKQAKRGRMKKEIPNVENQSMSAKRGTASKSLSEGMFPGRRRGRKPRRVEEIQSQESDSSPASSPTRRPRGRPMRRGRPPQLRLEAVVQSDPDSALTSTSTTIIEYGRPPKLTPQVSAESQPSSDTESVATQKLESSNMGRWTSSSTPTSTQMSESMDTSDCCIPGTATNTSTNEPISETGETAASETNTSLTDIRKTQNRDTVSQEIKDEPSNEHQTVTKAKISVINSKHGVNIKSKNLTETKSETNFPSESSKDETVEAEKSNKLKSKVKVDIVEQKDVSQGAGVNDKQSNSPAAHVQEKTDQPCGILLANLSNTETRQCVNMGTDDQGENKSNTLQSSTPTNSGKDRSKVQSTAQTESSVKVCVDSSDKYAITDRLKQEEKIQDTARVTAECKKTNVAPTKDASKVLKVGQDGMSISKDKNITQSVTKKCPPASVSVQGKKNIKPRKKGLKSVEEIVSKLKTDNIANTGEKTQQETSTKTPPAKLKVEPAGPLCSGTEEIGIRVTSQPVGQGKPSEERVECASTTTAGHTSKDNVKVTSETNIKMRKSQEDEKCTDRILPAAESSGSDVPGDTKSSSETGPSEKPQNKCTTKEANDEKNTFQKSPDKSHEGTNVTTSISDTIEMEHCASQTSDRSAKILSEDDHVKLQNVTVNVITEGSMENVEKDDSNIPSFKSRPCDDSSSKPLESPGLCEGTSGVKNVASAYSIDEPLDLSKKSCKSRSASPAVLCNGVEQAKSSESPLNLSKQDASSQQPPSVSQVDGGWDSSDSEHDTGHCTCNLYRSESLYSHGRLHYVTRHHWEKQCCSRTLCISEQLDGVTDPVGDKDSSDPGGGNALNNTETLPQTTPQDSMNVQVVFPVYNITPDENNPHGTDSEQPIQTETVPAHDTIETGQLEADESTFSTSETKEIIKSQENESDSHIQQTAETDDLVASSEREEKPGCCVTDVDACKNSENGSESEGSLSDNVEMKRGESALGEDLCLFDMECDDIDGYSENITCNKVIIPKVKTSKHTPKEEFGSQKKNSKRQSVHFVDLTNDSDNEAKMTEKAKEKQVNPCQVASKNVNEKSATNENPSTSSNMVSITSSNNMTTGNESEKTSGAAIRKLKTEESVPCIGPPRIEKEYLKVPNPTTAAKPLPTKSFTDSFSEFLAKLDANKHSPTETVYDTDKCSSGSSKQSLSGRVKTEPGTRCRYGSGRGRRYHPGRIGHSSRGTRRSLKSLSSDEEEEEEGTEEMESQVEEEEEEPPQNKDGDYMPPIILQTESGNPASAEDIPLRRSSRRVSQKVDYTVDLEHSSPSETEDWTPLSGSGVSDAESVKNNTEKGTSVEQRINENRPNSTQESQKTEVKEAAYESDTETEDQEDLSMTKIKPLTDSRLNNSKRKKIKGVYDTDESSDYIISDFNDSDEDFSLTSKRGRKSRRGKKRGQGRGLKQTIDYICSQLDGQNDSTSSGTDLDAPLTRCQKKTHKEGKSDHPKTGNKQQVVRRTRSENQKKPAKNSKNRSQNQKKYGKTRDQAIPDSSPEKENKNVSSFKCKEYQGQVSEDGDSTSETETENKAKLGSQREKSDIESGKCAENAKDNKTGRRKEKAENVSVVRGKKESLKQDELDSECENVTEREPSSGLEKKRKTRTRKMAASLLPVRSSPRKSAAHKSIIDRLKEEEMASYTSSDTEAYLEPMKDNRSKKQERPRQAAECESELEGVSDGTEDYWSEEEELLKINSIVKEEFDKDFMKKKDRKWSLICNNLDDWKCLAKKFKDSEVKCEKQLYTCIMQDFLAELPKLYRFKEEQIMGRAKELAKLKEKIRRQSLGEGDTGTSSDEDREHLSEEVKREQFFKWQKEEEERELNRERERLKKDRAKRARNRELRAEGKTDVESENEDEESTEEEELEESDRNLRSRQRKPPTKLIESSSLEESTMEALTKVLRTVQEQEDAWIFNDQVEEEYAPNYYEIIEEAMWLGRIEEKLESGLYQAVEEFEADFQLMWDNCNEYNGSDSEYTEVSKELDKVFKKAMRKHLPRYNSRSEDVGSQGHQKTTSPVRGSSKRSHKTESSNIRSSRNASSQARQAMKYAEMSSDEFEGEKTAVSGDEGQDSGPSSGKKRKRDTKTHTNKAGLRVAPAPEKCGEGGPLDMVEIQKVDRDQFGVPPYGPQNVGSSGQMMGSSGQWPMRTPQPQGCFPGMNHMGPGAQYGGRPEQSGMEQQGDMRPPQTRMSGPHRPHNMPRYPPHMAPSQQYGHYPTMHGTQFTGQRPHMPLPPGYGYNRQMNPMMQHQQNMSQNPAAYQQPSGANMQHPTGDASNTSMHSSLGSPTSDKVLSPKSNESPALSQRSAKVCSPPGYPPRSPAMRGETERAASPCMSSPRSDTPGSINQTAGFPGSPGMRLTSPGIPHKREPGMASPQHMPPPSTHPHQMGYLPRSSMPPHMMEYTHRPGSPMMRPGHMTDRYPNPTGYGGRFPGSPQMNMYDPKAVTGSPMSRMAPPRGPTPYPSNQPPLQPQREAFAQPGSFTSLLQDLDDLPPPPPVGNTVMEGFTDTVTKQGMLGMDSAPAAQSTGMPPNNFSFGGTDTQPQRPNMVSPVSNPPVSVNQTMQEDTRGSMHAALSSSHPTGNMSSYSQESVAISRGITPTNSNTISATKSDTVISPSTKMTNLQTGASTTVINDKSDTLQSLDSTVDKSKGVEPIKMSPEQPNASVSSIDITGNDYSSRSKEVSQIDTETNASKEQVNTKLTVPIETNPSDKIVENSSLMADLLSPEYKCNTKMKGSNTLKSDKMLQSPDRVNTESSELGRMMSPSQAGSLPTTTVTDSQGFSGEAMTTVSSQGRMEGYPYRHPQPHFSSTANMSQRPPPQWAPYGPRHMQSVARPPNQIPSAAYPPRMPDCYMPTRKVDASDNSQQSMLSQGQRAAADVNESKQVSHGDPGSEGYGSMDQKCKNAPSKDGRAGMVEATDSTNLTAGGPQTNVSANNFWNTPGEHCPPYMSPNQISRNDSKPSQWNAHTGSASQNNVTDGMPQRQYPMGYPGNIPSENMPPNHPVKYSGNSMTSQNPMSGTPSGPSQMGFGQSSPQLNPNMHIQHNQRMFSPQPYGQFSPSSDMSGHSNTLSGDPGRGDEMEEEDFGAKSKKGKGKGKVKAAAKKKASKKDSLEQVFQEPPEKKSKSKKSKKKKNEPLEESSNDSDMYMSMSGQKQTQGFLQQPPPFGNQGHPFMGGSNQMPNNKLPFGHPGHPMSSYNMPTRPRQQNPSGSLAGMMNMVNQMPVPEQESMVGGLRPESQQAGFVGEPGMPPMGMYQGGDGMNPAYPQMPHPQFTETPEYMRRFQHSQQAYRIQGSQALPQQDMFVEQSQRQMGSNKPQEVPIVSSLNTNRMNSSALHPDSSLTTAFSTNQTQPLPTCDVSTTANSSVSTSISPVNQVRSDMSRDPTVVSSAISELPPVHPGSSLQSTAEMCSNHVAISCSSESQKQEQTNVFKKTETGQNMKSDMNKEFPAKLDNQSDTNKLKEEAAKKELLSSNSNPSLMLTPPESPKSASCSTNVSLGKVNETPPPEKQQVQPSKPVVSERSDVNKEDIIKVSQNVASQRTVDQKSDLNEGDKEGSSVSGSNSESLGHLGMSTQDSVGSMVEKTSIDQQSAPNNMDIATSQPDQGLVFKAPIASQFQHPSDMQVSQRPPGFSPRPSPEGMKMMPPPGMQGGSYMSQYYSSQSGAGSQQAMMMSGHSDMSRHSGYMMQQHYQQSMMGMHNSSTRMAGMSHHMMHPSMQQSHMMYSYMQGGQMSSQMGGHMMSNHMMQSHGASSPLQPSSTSSPGPQYQQL